MTGPVVSKMLKNSSGMIAATPPSGFTNNSFSSVLTGKFHPPGDLLVLALPDER
jgi:hypothetical protein